MSSKKSSVRGGRMSANWLQHFSTPGLHGHGFVNGGRRRCKPCRDRKGYIQLTSLRNTQRPWLTHQPGRRRCRERCKSSRPGAVIEKAPVILLQQSDKDFLEATSLFRYYFLVNDKNIPVVLGLGYSSLYNHTIHSNANYLLDRNSNTMSYFALENIPTGTEICIKYAGEPGHEFKEWFESGGIIYNAK